jgi:hypothetical protein
MGINRIVIVLLPVAFLAALCTWGPAWARRLGLDICRLPELGWTLEANRLRGEELDAESRRLTRQYHRQVAVAGAVIEGRMTLLEAAAAVRDIRADEPPKVRAVARRDSEAATEEEWFCRLVIRFVKEVLEDRRPAEARAWVKRLEAELEQRLRRGPLRLPDPGAIPVPEVKNDRQ